MDRRTRSELSNLSARLMVEGGMDWRSARAKAARSLGVAQADARQLEEADILGALQTRQQLFSPGAADEIRRLRMAALQVMRILREFDPRLVGAIAAGTVTPHTPIEIQVQVDSEKDLELLLLNVGVGYVVVGSPDRHAIKYRCDRSEPAVLITANIRTGAGIPRHSRFTPDALSLGDLETLVANDLA